MSTTLASWRKFWSVDILLPPGHPFVSIDNKGLTLSLHVPPIGTWKPNNRKRSHVLTLPCPRTFVQEREAALGISHLGACHSKSYSGLIRLTHEIMVHAVHCNGLHPSLKPGEQTIIWVMTCAPLTVPEYLKVLIREELSKIGFLGNVPREYEAL